MYFVLDASGSPIEVTYCPSGGSNAFYYYVKNLQGDVTAILNSSGTVVVQYTYDAWGNVLSISGSMASTLGVQNPFRYRGYVYDQETGLYYLQSRYYNPTWGRFINADGLVSTGQGMLGNNMFSYCLNNPVMYQDSGGAICVFSFLGDTRTQDIIITGGGGGGYAAGYAMKSYLASKQLIQEVDEFVNNTDEATTHYNLLTYGISFYKGVFVFTASWLGGAAFSFGIIGIGSENLNKAEFNNTLNHEYGHYVHFSMIGPGDYFVTTAIPSLTFAGLATAGIFPDKYYYDLPWERTADYLGGVERQYLPYTNTAASAFWLFTVLCAYITPQ